MEEQTKICFTVNRHGITQNQKEEIIKILDKYNNFIVSHGDCIGSDTDFNNICVNYRNIHPNKNIRIDIYPQNYSKFRAFNKGDLIMDENTYLERNLNIVKTRQY
jgi:hypothetical protein